MSASIDTQAETVEPAAQGMASAQEGSPTAGIPDEQGVAPERVGTEQSGQPNWEKQAKDFQRKFSTLKNQVGGLEEFLKPLGGGEGVMRLLNSYQTLVSHPELGPVVAEFQRTGAYAKPQAQVTEAADDFEEDYLDPYAGKQIQHLESQLADIQRNLQSLTVDQTEVKRTNGMATVKGHMETFFREYPADFTPEELQHVERNFLDQVETTMATPQGVAAVAGMDYRQLKAALLIAAEDYLPTATQRRLQNQAKSRTDMATDAMPGIATLGNETEANPQAPQSINEARNKLRAFTREAFASASSQ